MSQLKRLDYQTQQTMVYSMAENLVLCVLYQKENPPKRKKEEQNSSVENATWGCVLPHVSRYITPNFICEDQLT
jgi:hypothetical protein